MTMRDNIQEIYKFLTVDETLLRLLTYQPSSAADDPLDTSKPNILDMDIEAKEKLIQDRIVTAPKFVDLDKEIKCRLLIYHGHGRKSSNHLFTRQEFCFDVFTHFMFDNVDQRLSWLCDRLDELMEKKLITGFGNMASKDRRPVSAPNDYSGYRLVYEFYNENF